MPTTSGRQYRFMQMMAHNPEKKRGKGAGPSPAVAREMIAKTSKAKRHQFAKRG